MPNKHFCQGPNCHTKTTQDRFLKSRGVVRGKYSYATLDADGPNQYGVGLHQIQINIFVVKVVNYEWLNINMPNIEQGRPIEFIRHRTREWRL